MLNCVHLFAEQCKVKRKMMALYVPSQEMVTFQELMEAAIQAQSFYKAYGIQAGSSVLILHEADIGFYASIIALLALGAKVVLIEPWMPVSQIQQALEMTRPRPQLFVSDARGFLLGLRVKAIREVPHWIRAGSIAKATRALGAALHVESVSPWDDAILSFKVGAVAADGEFQKCIVRNHGRNHGDLIRQHEVLSRHLGVSQLAGSDLCIFNHFVLSNLACGRGSVLIPSAWKSETLKCLDELAYAFQPTSLTCGPGFLIQLMENAELPSLKSIHMGGALTDRWIFEKGFQRWPDAHWGHVYSGTDVDVIACVDARLAVAESKKRGFFQTLFLGRPIPEIQPRIEPEGLWISGSHVCQGGRPESQKKDAEGNLWHFMGDRIKEDGPGWWYQGRSTQDLKDFWLEQRIYQRLGTSKCFIRKGWLVGEGLNRRKKEILHAFPEVSGVVEAKIFRDRYHRARLDRERTLQRGAKWLASA